MKPCKGCIHFVNNVFGHVCMLHSKKTETFDPLLGEMTTKTEGITDAKKMRSEGGECGPEARYYETFYQAIAAMLKKRLA